MKGYRSYQPTRQTRRAVFGLIWEALLEKTGRSDPLQALLESDLLKTGEKVLKELGGINLKFTPTLDKLAQVQQARELVEVVMHVPMAHTYMIYVVDAFDLSCLGEIKQPNLDQCFTRLCLTDQRFLEWTDFLAFTGGLKVTVPERRVAETYQRQLGDPQNEKRLSWLRIKYLPHGRKDFEASLEPEKRVLAVWNYLGDRYYGEALVESVNLDTVTVQITKTPLAYSGDQVITLPLFNHTGWNVYQTVWPELPYAL